jgi:hypothetical protein
LDKKDNVDIGRVARRAMITKKDVSARARSRWTVSCPRSGGVLRVNRTI